MNDITRADFKEEGPHQWTLNHGGYRVVAHRTDGAIEMTIRASITEDPTLQDWTQVLRTVNSFYKKERMAARRTE